MAQPPTAFHKALGWGVLALALAGCGADDEATQPTPDTFTDRQDLGVGSLDVEGDRHRELEVECFSVGPSVTFRGYDGEVLVRYSLRFPRSGDNPRLDLLELQMSDEIYFLEEAELTAEDSMGWTGEIQASGTLSSADVRDERAVTIKWDCTRGTPAGPLPNTSAAYRAGWGTR